MGFLYIQEEGQKGLWDEGIEEINYLLAIALVIVVIAAIIGYRKEKNYYLYLISREIPYMRTALDTYFEQRWLAEFIAD